MSPLSSVLGALALSYSRDEMLYEDVLTKLVYLTDWKNSLVHGKQISSILWYVNVYGPYSHDIVVQLNTSSIFFSPKTSNFYTRRSITLVDPEYEPILTESDTLIINNVIEATKNLQVNELTKLVYSTYPIIVSRKFECINLLKLAERYKNLDNTLVAS